MTISIIDSHRGQTDSLTKWIDDMIVHDHQSKSHAFVPFFKSPILLCISEYYKMNDKMNAPFGGEYKEKLKKKKRQHSLIKNKNSCLSLK